MAESRGHVEAVELDHHPGSVDMNAEAVGKFPFHAFEFSEPSASSPYVKVVSPWAFEIESDLTVGGNAAVTGDLDVTSNLDVDGDAEVGGDLTVTGSITAANFPAGIVLPYAGSSAPTGFLLCDGSAVSRTTYSVLYGVIGTTFGAGDSSTTFNVPDLREAYPVGVGTRASGVTAHDAFALADFKDDQAQGHIHNGGSGVTAGGTGENKWLRATGNGADIQRSATTMATDGANGTPRTGTVTRGKGLGLNFIIKT